MSLSFTHRLHGDKARRRGETDGARAETQNLGNPLSSLSNCLNPSSCTSIFEMFYRQQRSRFRHMENVKTQNAQPDCVLGRKNERAESLPSVPLSDLWTLARRRTDNIYLHNIQKLADLLLFRAQSNIFCVRSRRTSSLINKRRD